MDKFKKAAAEFGYDLWWCKSLRLWMATKENYETIYYSSNELKCLGIEKFIEDIACNGKCPVHYE